VGGIPEDALDSIFTPRRGNDRTSRVGVHRNDGSSSDEPGKASILQTAFSSTDQEDDDYQPLPNTKRLAGATQQLFQAIPMDDRQFSIPSIRMANQLDGSIASCNTTYTDDDESTIMHYGDDASLSSRGSFASLEDLHTAFRLSLSSERQPSSFESDDQTQLQSHNLITAEPSNLATTGTDAAQDACCSRLRRSQKRKEQRDRQAYEWLRNVKAAEGEVAEAASSKFLTGGKHNQDSHGQSVMRERPQKRLSATPAVDTRSFAMLKDMSRDEHISFGSQDSNMKIHVS